MLYKTYSGTIKRTSNSIFDRERHARRFRSSSISYPMPSRSKNKSVRFVRLQMIKIQVRME